MTIVYIPVKQEKSLGLALVLTVLFGPLGLFYATVWGGLVMALFGPFLFFLVAILGLAWNNTWIMGMSIGMWLVFIAADWLTSIIWSVISVYSYNKKVKQENQRQMMLMNSFQGQGPAQVNSGGYLQQNPVASNTTEQANLGSNKPTLQEWQKKNPGKSINDYFSEFGR